MRGSLGHSSKATSVKKEDFGGISSGSRMNGDLKGVLMQWTNKCLPAPRYTEPVGIGSSCLGFGGESDDNYADPWVSSCGIN